MMMGLQILWDKEKNQIADDYITLLEHPDLYCPAMEYVRWSRLIPELEQKLAEENESEYFWCERFQEGLIQHLEPVQHLSDRQKALVLGTLNPISKGASIQIDPDFYDKYFEDSNRYKELSDALAKLILSEVKFPAQSASTMYIASALGKPQMRIIEQLQDAEKTQINKYLKVVDFERNLSTEDTSSQNSSEIENFLVEIQQSNKSESQLEFETDEKLKEVDLKINQSKAELSLVEQQKLSQERIEILEEHEVNLENSSEKIESVVEYPKQRIKQILEIKHKLHDHAPDKEINVFDRLRSFSAEHNLNKDFLLKILSILIGPIIFLLIIRAKS